MTVHFEVTERMRGETEEYIDLDLYGEMSIHVSISLEGEIKEIVFEKQGGSVCFTAKEVVWRARTPSANYTSKIEPTSGTLEFMLAPFEDKLMPYLDKIKAKQLTQEEADKIYGNLLEALKDNMEAGLMFAVMDLFKDEVRA